MFEHKLKPLCTSCRNFKLIALVSTEQKWVQISVGKWNKKKERKNRRSAVAVGCLFFATQTQLCFTVMFCIDRRVIKS